MAAAYVLGPNRSILQSFILVHFVVQFSHNLSSSVSRLSRAMFAHAHTTVNDAQFSTDTLKAIAPSMRYSIRDGKVYRGVALDGTPWDFT